MENECRDMLTRRKVCVIVPTYNNHKTVLEVVERLRPFASDIVVVNDGSTDETQTLLENCTMPELTVVSYPKNQGKGHALRTGFRKALEMGFDYAITIDSDGQHYPEDLPRFVVKLEECLSKGERDVLIVGNRKLQQENMPGGNTFANYFSNFWFALQTWQYLPDTQTGFRLYPLHRLHGLNLITARYEAELELMVLAAWHGVKLVSTPIRVYYPPKGERVSHFRPFWDFARIFVLNTVLCVLCLVCGWWMMLFNRCRRMLAVAALLVALVPALQAQKLTPYLAEGNGQKPAVIVCPGGSYSWLDMQTEGIGVAQWLQSQGISAFVLEYPVQGVLSFWSHYRYLLRGHQYPDAIDALQSAIREVRAKAEEYHIDRHRIGAMGFSAGGHLVTSAAEFFHSDEDRPDFVVPVYPVVTLRKNPWTHRRSRRALLGEYRKHQTKWQDSLSLELHVRADMPPVFLVNCVDDPIVHYHNSELLDAALKAQKVPHVYVQFEHGGHGFGADTLKAGEEAIQWKAQFLKWLNNGCL